MIAISSAVSSSMLLDERRDRVEPGAPSRRASGARRRRAGKRFAPSGRTRIGWRTPCSRIDARELVRARRRRRPSAAARGFGSMRSTGMMRTPDRPTSAVVGGQQADDRGRELAILGQATRGGGAEVRPGQGRSPPGRARDRCGRRRGSPAYDVIGRPASGASPSLTVLRTMLLKTWWSPTTRSSSSMSRARFVRLS